MLNPYLYPSCPAIHSITALTVAVDSETQVFAVFLSPPTSPLFYLNDTIMHLEWGKTIWKAGVPELFRHRSCPLPLFKWRAWRGPRCRSWIAKAKKTSAPGCLRQQTCSVTEAPVEAASTWRHFSWSGTYFTGLTFAKWSSCLQMLPHTSIILILPKSGYKGHVWSGGSRIAQILLLS